MPKGIKLPKLRGRDSGPSSDAARARDAGLGEAHTDRLDRILHQRPRDDAAERPPGTSQESMAREPS
jgi:hypothetical protein